MKTPDFSHLPKPNIPWKGMARGTLAFGKALLKSPKNALGMGLSLFVTALDDTPYKVINADQSALIEKNSERLAIFVPGFQLGAWSLEALKSAFNEQGIPVLFPEKLPYGFDAVLCREHPEVLESYIAEYVEEIRQKYPDREIILLGHSYGGAKVAHVAKTFENDKKIIPIAMTPTLGKSGIISKAAHAIFFPHQSAVFGGEYDYLEKAEKYIHEHDLAFVMYDAKDGWIAEDVQVANIGQDKIVQITQESEKSPGHYNTNRSLEHARKITKLLMERILSGKSTQP